MARRSARLASGASKPPKKARKAAPPANLDAVAERQESLVNEPTQSLDAVMSSPTRLPQTPSTASMLKPPMSEMHPSKVHPTMAAPSSALRLGFTDIKPTTSTHPGAGPQQSTPTKSNAPSSPFTFQFTRTNVESTLGPEAQRIMNEMREDTIKIKAELAAKREQERVEEEQVNARKFAQPKGKAGRFSAVHMADFKKMDSIENHPSAFRATPGRSTPATGSSKGTKRSQSSAELDDRETRVKAPTMVHSSKTSKKAKTPTNGSESPNKRAKQRVEDDAPTSRPISRDDSNTTQPKTPGKAVPGLTRSKSTFSNLMSPTHASLARAASTRTPTATRVLPKSPTKATLTGLKKSATVGALDSLDVDKEEPSADLRTPSRFDRVMSIFAKHKATASASRTSIPKPGFGVSETPAPVLAQKELPPAPLTTPGKSSNRIDFTPAPKHAALAQNSPSPVKSGIPRSKTTNNLVNYPSLDSVLENADADHVSYPDLAGYRPLPEPPIKRESMEGTTDEKPKDFAQPAVASPGNFTFRSDQTIRFSSTTPKGFGAHSGQASVRQVRPSIMPTTIPDAFPKTEPKGKENMPPQAQQAFDIQGFPHGVANKKRYRVEDDEAEAEREAAMRAAKKMKAASVPEGEALVAPRLASARKGTRSPSRLLMKTPARSPTKSRIPAAPTTPGDRNGTAISRRRLSYLAKPKQRK
ncbi:hypothetical protein VPNG_00788 [Cytospora leucostoma]|uniref:Erythromycin esterase n=1 Tax=Cytospora leucostoma TaxID=1230097 RepID=A0A423XP02_9PEZI|nr:hypothetical protein VPNG_00788 [Cytospora leucostoma]